MVTAAEAQRRGGGGGGVRGGQAWASGQPPHGRGLGRCWEPPRLVGRREVLYLDCFHSLLFLSLLHFSPTLPNPLPAGPCIPVALSNLGRKPFQKAQVWARSPRLTSRGRRFRLTYCCAPPVYGGHFGALGSPGSLGSLREEGHDSASSKPAPLWELGMELRGGGSRQAASRPHALFAPRRAPSPPFHCHRLILLPLLHYPHGQESSPSFCPPSICPRPFPVFLLHRCLCFSHLKN